MRVFLNIMSVISSIVGFCMLLGFCLVEPYGVQFSAGSVLFIVGMTTGVILAVTKKSNQK